MPVTPQPFTIDVPPDVLTDLHSRLAQARIPTDADNDAWQFGVNGDYMRSFVDYWLHEFDWPNVQEQLNILPNYSVTIDRQPLHFVHVPGRGPEPLPLILTHGYPWSYWDYRKVIGALTDPGAHGGDPADAFHVVVPSLPGYCFSVPLRNGGISARGTAALWVKLMRDVLGYDRFGTAGGDWGAVISVVLGYEHAANVCGLYVTVGTFATALRNRFEEFTIDDLDSEEREWYEREWRHKRPNRRAQAQPLFRTPQTESYAGYDSPLALAVKIVETRRASGDTHGDVESIFTREELVTNVMLYWVTNSWASAQRFYWYTGRDPVILREEQATPLIEVPTGLGAFPGDVLYTPRKLAARDANITYWSLHPAGGHFAAGEQPEIFIDDLRNFFRPLR